ncbi:DUF2171 domain-containing protein, partial [Acinetobacter sp. SCC474]
VIASCGKHIGTVDHLEGTDQIKLTKNDSSDGHHHLIPVAWVAEVKDGDVILSKNAQEVEDSWKAL